MGVLLSAASSNFRVSRAQAAVSSVPEDWIGVGTPLSLFPSWPPALTQQAEQGGGQSSRSHGRWLASWYCWPPALSSLI